MIRSAWRAAFSEEAAHFRGSMCLHAAWEITSRKYGANALGVQRIIGLRSYKTAWASLHKFRRAMVNPGRDRLSGTVEAEESYVGCE